MNLLLDLTCPQTLLLVYKVPGNLPQAFVFPSSLGFPADFGQPSVFGRIRAHWRSLKGIVLVPCYF